MAITRERPTNLLESVMSWCGQHDVLVVDGYMENSGSLPVVQYNQDSRQRIDQFFESLRQLEVEVVFVNKTELTREVWQQKEQEMASLGDVEDADLPSLKNYESFIGQIGSVEIRAVASNPPLILSLNSFAEWFDFFFSYPADEVDDDMSDDEGEVSLELQGREEELAWRLARNSDFQRAKNDNQREYVMSKVLGSEPDLEQINIWRMHQAAKTILELEIRPKLEAELTHKAESLRKEGLSMGKIAIELNVSLHKVRQLLT